MPFFFKKKTPEEIKKQKTILDVKNWTNSYLKKRAKFLIDRDKVNSLK